MAQDDQSQNVEQEHPKKKYAPEPLRGQQHKNPNITPRTPYDFAREARRFSDNESQLDLVRRDYERISGEINQKRNCKSTFFLTTITLLSSAAFVLITIAASATKIAWMWLGATIPLTVLTISILANFQKARTVNLRKAYLACLASFIATGKVARYFSGWDNAMTCPTDGGRGARMLDWAAIAMKGAFYGRQINTPQTVQ